MSDLLRLYDLSVTSLRTTPARVEDGDDGGHRAETQIHLNEDYDAGSGASDEDVTLDALYGMMGAVYRGCDFFCQTFEERYPTPSALAAEVDAYKAWRRQVERARTTTTTAPAPSTAVKAPEEASEEEQGDGGAGADLRAASKCAAPSYFVASLGAKRELVGFVRISPSKVPRQGHTADLTMGLAPSAQGRGLGARLLQLTIERIRAENQALKKSSDGYKGQGIEILYLMVREDNRAAIGLYRKLGFEQLAVLHKDTKISDELYYDGIMMRLFL